MLTTEQVAECFEAREKLAKVNFVPNFEGINPREAVWLYANPLVDCLYKESQDASSPLTFSLVATRDSMIRTPALLPPPEYLPEHLTNRFLGKWLLSPLEDGMYKLLWAFKQGEFTDFSPFTAVFTVIFDTKLGAQSISNRLFFAEQYLKNNPEKATPEPISALDVLTIPEESQKISALIQNDSKILGEKLRDDQTGFSTVDYVVDFIKGKARLDVPVISYEIPGCVIYGAESFQRLYKAIYPLAEKSIASLP